MIGISNSVGAYRSFVDPAASAYFAATGITGTTEQQAVNTLVTSLKSAGVWSKMKAVYPFVTDNRNLLGYTNTFSSLGSYQTDGTITLTENYATAPNGTNTATRMYGNAASSYIYNSATIAALGGTGNKVLSVYLKAGSDTQVAIGINSDGTTSQTTCNLTSSWQRFEVTKNVVSTSGNYSIFIGNLGQSQDVIAWGIQYESGSSATTYQPIATTQQSYISNQFKYNLVNPVDSDAAFRLVFNGGWTMSNQGATPNGTNGYADTKFIPNLNWSTSSQHISFYSRSNLNGGYSIGAYGDGSLSETALIIKYSNGRAYLGLGTGALVSVNNADGTGFYVAKRTTNSTATMFRNNSLLLTNSNVNLALNTISLYLGAVHANTTVADYDNRQCAFSSIGDGLSDTEAAAFYNAVQTFNTSLSRQV